MGGGLDGGGGKGGWRLPKIPLEAVPKIYSIMKWLCLIV